MKESDRDYLEAQSEAIRWNTGVCCMSLLRFLTDHLPELPLSVYARLLDQYDVLMLLVPLLERKPWEQTSDDGTQRRFLSGHWTRTPEAELRKMHKCEAQ